jgi:hypothetical protein
MAISEKCACSRDKCDESCEVYHNIVHQEKDTKTEPKQSE